MKENVKIRLTGDFNFPPREVKWVNNEEGFLPNIKLDNKPEKVALNLLLDLTNNFSLEQIGSRNTREENTLDLAFTNEAEAFTDC